MATKKILHIEDDQDNQTLIKLFLRNEPYELIGAETPDQALEIAKSQSVDVIIVDLNLQGQGDGAEVIRSIRALENYKSVPIIVFSGFDQHHFRQYGIDDMINKFFRKPTSKKTLVEALRELVDTKENHT